MIAERLALITEVADQYNHGNPLTGERPFVRSDGQWCRVDGFSGPKSTDGVKVPEQFFDPRLLAKRLAFGSIPLTLGVGAGFAANHMSYQSATVSTMGAVVAMFAFLLLAVGAGLVAAALEGRKHTREIEVDDPVTAQLIVAAWRLWLSATPEEREFLGDVPSDCRELAAGAVAADQAEAGDDPTDPRVGRWAEQTAEALRARHTSRCQLYATMLAEAASAIRDRRVRADTPARVAKLKQAFDEAQHDPMADRMAEHLDRIAAVREALNDPALAEEIPDPDAHANAWADVHDADFSRPLQQPGTRWATCPPPPPQPSPSP